LPPCLFIIASTSLRVRGFALAIAVPPLGWCFTLSFFE
jgi:hypothetical protein